MFELSEICGEIEDQELRAYAIAMTISASCESISETWLKLYLTTCAVDREQMDIHIVVFLGMKLLVIDCDCDNNGRSCMINRFQEHPGYNLGQIYLKENATQYLEARGRVESLRADLI